MKYEDDTVIACHIIHKQSLKHLASSLQAALAGCDRSAMPPVQMHTPCPPADLDTLTQVLEQYVQEFQVVSKAFDFGAYNSLRRCQRLRPQELAASERFVNTVKGAVPGLRLKPKEIQRVLYHLVKQIPALNTTTFQDQHFCKAVAANISVLLAHARRLSSPVTWAEMERKAPESVLRRLRALREPVDTSCGSPHASTVASEGVLVALPSGSANEWPDFSDTSEEAPRKRQAVLAAVVSPPPKAAHAAKSTPVPAKAARAAKPTPAKAARTPKSTPDVNSKLVASSSGKVAHAAKSADLLSKAALMAETPLPGDREGLAQCTSKCKEGKQSSCADRTATIDLGEIRLGCFQQKSYIQVREGKRLRLLVNLGCKRHPEHQRIMQEVFMLAKTQNMDKNAMLAARDRL